MKILAVYPIYNQEDRIQPFFRAIEEQLLNQIDEWLFVNENSNDNSAQILRSELEGMKNKHSLKTISTAQNRAKTFESAYKYASKNDFDYMVFFNEGWEDNIFELINIIRSNEFQRYDLVISCRHVYEFSIGSLYNIFSNILTSIVTRKLIRETKGDSINIIKINTINIEELGKDPNILFFQIILKMLKNKKNILFSDVDNGLNSKSYVQLNTKRFIQVLFKLIQFKLR